MSWQAVQWALEGAPMLSTEAGNHDSTARLVLVALAEKARGEVPRAFPSLTTLRVMTGLDRRVIQRALGRLAEGGLISPSGARRGCTVWLLEVSRKRPVSDLEAIEREVELAKEQDRERKRKSRTQNPESGTQSPDTVDTSRTLNPESSTQNPDSGTLRPDVQHAEPPRTGKGTGNEPIGNEPVPLERASADALASSALFAESTGNATKKIRPVDPRDGQAQELATGYYEDMSKMVPFMGVRQIIKQALGNFTYDQVRDALTHMSTVDRNRPLTRQTLLAAIEAPNGRTTRGYRPYSDPVDQSAYDEPLQGRTP